MLNIKRMFALSGHSYCCGWWNWKPQNNLMQKVPVTSPYFGLVAGNISSTFGKIPLMQRKTGVRSTGKFLETLKLLRFNGESDDLKIFWEEVPCYFPPGLPTAGNFPLSCHHFVGRLAFGLKTDLPSLGDGCLSKGTGNSLAQQQGYSASSEVSNLKRPKTFPTPHFLWVWFPSHLAASDFNSEQLCNNPVPLSLEPPCMQESKIVNVTPSKWNKLAMHGTSHMREPLGFSMKLPCMGLPTCENLWGFQ